MKRAREPSDWRTPLFVWRGALALDAARTLSWRGAWLAADAGDGAPSDAALATSDNVFDCEGVVEPAAGATAGAAGAPAGADAAAAGGTEGSAAAAGTAADVLRALAGRGAIVLARSGYLLDQGDGAGRVRFEDGAHALALGPLRAGGRECAAAAVGDTQFGRFVSFGAARAGAGGAAELTLARRYVRDADARAAWRDAQAALARCLALADPAGAAGTTDAAGKADAAGEAGAGAGGAPAAPPAAAAAAWARTQAALPWRLDKRQRTVALG